MNLSRYEIKPIVESVLDAVIGMAVAIIEQNRLQAEGRQQARRPSDHRSRIRCNTADTLAALYAPKIVQTPSSDTLIDARNFVEEYEEYHDSCSEMHDSAIAISQVGGVVRWRNITSLIKFVFG